MDMLISIKPGFLDKIRDGTKRFEFRKKRHIKDMRFMVFYATSPIKKIVGYTKIKRVLVGHKDYIWQKTQQYAGISKSSYSDYFKTKNTAVAYELDNSVFFTKQYSFEDLNLDIAAPQSYVYIPEGVIDGIIRNLV